MFNNASRTTNAAKASAVGTICGVINLGIGFFYRSVFLHFLSSSYLGINGLFTNILQILSFAELGIGGAISFRLYKPISDGNTEKVGQLMNFFKRVYFLIALTISSVGMILYPFLDLFIKDTSEIPSDINLHFIYVLYLFQTVSSYICVSPQMLLAADQKQYKLTLLQSASNILKYMVQIIVLAFTRSFTLVLLFGIITTLLMNITISTYVKRRYAEVFSVKCNISSSEKKAIFSDTKATLCHKMGSTVLNSTDSIILSSFVGIVTTGLYSNYSLIVSSLNSVLSQLLGSFTASLGNTHFMLDENKSYTVYKRLLFANFWISGLCTTCLLNLISDFISIWLGKDMLLNQIVIVVICLQFYLESIRTISTAYTFGSGLFNKDIIRPLIEATLNIVISVIMVIKIGIAGVFLGTVVSHLLTVTWREPLLLYKYEFKKSVKDYWLMFVKFSVLTFVISLLISIIKGSIHFVCSNILSWIAEALVCMLIYNVLLLIVFKQSPDLIFYVDLIKNKLSGYVRARH